MSSLVQFITLLDPSARQGFSVPSIKPCLGDGVGVCHQESNTVFTRLLISVVGSHSFHKCVIEKTCVFYLLSNILGFVEACACAIQTFPEILGIKS